MNKQGGKAKIKPNKDDIHKARGLDGLFRDFGEIFGSRQETIDIEHEEIETKVNKEKLPDGR